MCQYFRERGFNVIRVTVFSLKLYIFCNPVDWTDHFGNLNPWMNLWTYLYVRENSS